MRVLVPGGDGILGHQMCRRLGPRFEFWATSRQSQSPAQWTIYGDALAVRASGRSHHGESAASSPARERLTVCGLPARGCSANSGITEPRCPSHCRGGYCGRGEGGRLRCRLPTGHAGRPPPRCTVSCPPSVAPACASTATKPRLSWTASFEWLTHIRNLYTSADVRKSLRTAPQQYDPSRCPG